MTEVIQGHTEVIPSAPAPASTKGTTEVLPEVLPFDTAKYVLGKSARVGMPGAARDNRCSGARIGTAAPVTERSFRSAGKSSARPGSSSNASRRDRDEYQR